MGLFDVFKKKDVEEQAVIAPQSEEIVKQPEEVLAQPESIEPEQQSAQVAETSDGKKSLLGRFFTREKKETLDKGLEKTKQGLFAKIAHTVAGKSTIDDDVLDELEEVFITSYVGVATTIKILNRIQ